MDAIHQWGLEFINSVQSIASPPLTAVMKAFTFLGNSGIFIILLLIIYWCVDEKKGLRISVMVLISFWINMHLKQLIGQDRPPFDMWLINDYMESKSFPSGHAQNTVVLYFILASFIIEKFPKYKNRIFACAAILCSLIGFSRIYLGVHYPADVLGGWVIGGALLCGYFMLSGRIEVLLIKGGHRAGMITSAAFSFILITFFKYSDIFEALISGGVILGLGIGYCLNRRHVGFKSSPVPGRTNISKHLLLALRFLLGITGFVLVFTGAGKLIPFDSPNNDLYNFIRFSLVGLWVSLAAPWIFIKLRLGETNAG
jgi:membrane-associated phospholipid phosphatase